MRSTILALALAAGTAGSALAQPMPPVREEGAGVMPPSERVGRTDTLAFSGKAKPPGAAVGSEGGTRPDLEEKSRRIDRKIRTGICTGCQ